MFWWITPLMKVGYERTITPPDLYKLDDTMEIEKLSETFERHLKKRITYYQNQHIMKKYQIRKETQETSTVDRETDLENFILPKSALFMALYHTFYFQFMKSIVQMCIQGAGTSLQPLLLKKLTEFVQLKAQGLNPAIGKGIGYSIGTAVFIAFVGIMVNHSFYNAMMVGAKTRSVLIRTILKKSFVLNQLGRHKYPEGKINALITTDLNRIDFAGIAIPILVSTPFSVVIAVALLIHSIGVYALIGVTLYFVCSVILGVMMKYMINLRVKAQVHTDDRVTLIKEILKNFKMIKYYSWEAPYLAKMSQIRERESEKIFQLQTVRNLLYSLAQSLPILTSMTAFCVLFAVKRGKTSAGSIFASLSWFTALANAFFLVPFAVSMCTDASVALDRAAEFLSQGEIDPAESYDVIAQESRFAIKVENASFQWPEFNLKETNEDKKNKINLFHKLKDKKKEESSPVSDVVSVVSKNFKSLDGEPDSIEVNSKLKEKFTGLHNINLEINHGEFVVITGSIGSGKTSLLAAISGTMNKVKGEVTVNGSLLSCGYPWVQNASVRENITFGSPYDEKKYDTVVFCCSLLNDFKQLPGGDMTQVGERGITLSGGQKARINLARAVYAGKDIILLDDVLSAVDAKVAKHIIDSCIMGYLKEKTRVLATHQLHLIGSADKIVFLNGDGSADVGSFQELSVKNVGFMKLMEHTSELSKDKKPDDDDEVAKTDLVKVVTTVSTTSEDFKITKDEERAVNVIGMDVVWEYARYASGVFRSSYLPLLLLSLALFVFFSIFSNTWLSFWVSYKFEHKSDDFYRALYIVFGLVTVVVTVIVLCMIVYGTVTSSKKLNLMAAKRLMRVPMSYFDITPTGRILNRFSKDTDVLDNEISDELQQLIIYAGMIIGSLILCCIYLPWFTIAVPLLLILLVLLTNFFQATSREVKRLEAIQRSCVFSQFDESLSGMNTIKAYKAENRFLNDNDNLINKMNEANFMTIALQRYFAINMSMLVSLMALLIALLCCFRVFSINASSTGLLLTYVLQVTEMLTEGLRSYVMVENEMNSVERLKYYADELPQEPGFSITTSPALDPNWPTDGAIKFENVNLRYREGLPYALKNFSIDVRPHENIGVCGRTGAGKSTLMSCLYRLSEPEGRITIDGVDISKVNLTDLRTKLSIIPQDPVLFKGNIRENLDPFGQSSDDQLWDALRRAHLIEGSVLPSVKTQVNVRNESTMHKFHLLQTVEEDGGNFSLGERQLLALARALVRKTKILILDEATSSVDYETDSKIQKTIVEEFSNCTIL
ncbi:unnamed protein product [Ambrosiozyma monospora]|uniref:Unnamed protein product n=1 Tax=Ambrosiozyma monospora TaxID=43982 RepID=A0ACB5SU06_AMBMO|nr:unnamed protein product [Ambrosiozyma monospora]